MLRLCQSVNAVIEGGLREEGFVRGSDPLLGESGGLYIAAFALTMEVGS